MFRGHPSALFNLITAQNCSIEQFIEENRGFNLIAQYLD